MCDKKLTYVICHFVRQDADTVQSSRNLSCFSVKNTYIYHKVRYNQLLQTHYAGQISDPAIEGGNDQVT